MIAIACIRVVLRTDNVSAQPRVHVLVMLAPCTHGLNFAPKYIIYVHSLLVILHSLDLFERFLEAVCLLVTEYSPTN